MCVAEEGKILMDTYKRYHKCTKVDSEDMLALEKLSASNKIILFVKDGELYAKSPYY